MCSRVAGGVSSASTLAATRRTRSEAAPLSPRRAVPICAAAVLARSSGVGDNLKQQCACDGTVIWESTPDDFKPEKK